MGFIQERKFEDYVYTGVKGNTEKCGEIVKASFEFVGDSIPAELKDLDQWVVWSLIKKDDESGKPSKIPTRVVGNEVKNASLKFPLSYDEALAIYNKHKGVIAGLGFIFTENDPYVFIDFDKLSDNDERKNYADYPTFVETSQSGNGLHLIVKGKLKKPAFKPNSRLVEIYAQQRFCAITGLVTGMKFDRITDGQTLIDSLIEKYGEEGDSYSTNSRFVLPEIIPEGSRDNIINQYAWSLAGRRVDRGEALDLLHEANKRCKDRNGHDDPLDDDVIIDKWERAYSSIEQEDTQRELEQEDAIAFILENYVYIEESKPKYFCKIDKQVCSPTNLHNRFRGVFNGPTGFRTLFDLIHGQEMERAHHIGWHPTDCEIFEQGNKRYCNVYQKPVIEPEDGDVSIWLELMQHIYTDQTELVIQFMAFTLKHPETKIKWGILTHGVPRTGKSMTVQPLMRILGEGNGAAVISPDVVSAGWGNAYACKKVLVFEEIYMPDNKAFFNKFKLKLSNDDMEELNIKGQGLMYMQNRYSIFMFTNRHDALHYEKNETKMLVIKGPDRPIYGHSKESDDFYTRFMKELDFGRLLNRIYGYLLRIDISNFSYGKLPVITNEFKKLAHNSRPDWIQQLEEFIDSDDPRLPSIIKPLELKAFIKEHISQRVSFKAVNEYIDNSEMIMRIPSSGRLNYNRGEISKLSKRKFLIFYALRDTERFEHLRGIDGQLYDNNMKQEVMEAYKNCSISKMM